MSGASERANGRASGPVLTSLFLFKPDHSAPPMQDVIGRVNWLLETGGDPREAEPMTTTTKKNIWMMSSIDTKIMPCNGVTKQGLKP